LGHSVGAKKECKNNFVAAVEDRKLQVTYSELHTYSLDAVKLRDFAVLSHRCYDTASKALHKSTVFKNAQN